MKRFFLLLCTLGGALMAADKTSANVEHMVFEGTVIQGELGSIKSLIVTSEERPEFSPMALQVDEGPLEFDRISFEKIEHPQFRNSFGVELPK
jgi:hypothetical protein